MAEIYVREEPKHDEMPENETEAKAGCLDSRAKLAHRVQRIMPTGTAQAGREKNMGRSPGVPSQYLDVAGTPRVLRRYSFRWRIDALGDL